MERALPGCLHGGDGGIGRGLLVCLQVVLVFRSEITIQRFLDTIDYHSTVRQAGETAAKAGVRTLVLTHQVPTPAPGSEAEWVAQAAEAFDGEIVFGDDLTVVAVEARPTP